MSEARLKADQVIELASLLLDASCRPEGWDLVVEKLAKMVDAPAGGLELVDFADGRCIIQAGYGLKEAFREQYARQFAASNPFMERRSHFRQGRVVITDQVIPLTELRKTPFYREFLSPHGIEHILCATLFQEKDFFGFLNLARPRGMRPFNGQEAALLQTLVPAIQRALLVNRALVQLANERTVATSLLDNLKRGIILLDAHGKVVTLNRSAMHMMEGRDGMAYEDSGIRAVLAEENQRLKLLIQSALAGGHGERAAAEGSMLLTRISASTPLSILVTPLSRQFPLFNEPRARVAVFISDPERLPQGADGMLKNLYRFTDAECRLAVCMMRGFSLEECSAHMGITLNTARTHLKRLFSKTSTNRQGELIRLLLESPATLEMQ